MDESGSMGRVNFDLIKNFVTQMVDRIGFLIDYGIVRVGVVTYAETVGTTINLNEHNSTISLLSAISQLTYARTTETNTHLALAHVRTKMLTQQAGDRRETPNIVIVLTDGQSTDETATEVGTTFYIFSTAY